MSRTIRLDAESNATLRDLIFSTAKATYVEEWNRKMNHLKEVNRECYDKLAALDPKMERFVEKKKKAAKFIGKILPKSRKKLDIICRRSMEWQARWARDLKYEGSAPTSAETSTAPSATVSQRGRGRGRGRGGSRCGKARSATPAVSQPAPTLPPPAPPLPAPAPTSSTAPPLPPPATPPLPAPAPTRSTAPPLPRTKNFGVRRSGRLKIGVKKAKAGPSETIDLTAY
ncbi:uncharacterized protein LOC107480563 [Arachis duranensis]|uniref:Uncharacterized protein LOC107480563 n=1 Tax=Arachis duranensis TaxID=130453 RepID=A0A6P4CSX4_ARADU|nr:uncharacterized protein LOC107480563 [Arachis duranensis]